MILSFLYILKDFRILRTLYALQNLIERMIRMRFVSENLSI